MEPVLGALEQRNKLTQRVSSPSPGVRGKAAKDPEKASYGVAMVMELSPALGPCLVSANGWHARSFFFFFSFENYH